MAKRIKVLAVCGFGIGTSLILKMNIDDVLKKNGINAEVTHTDITTASSCPADIIFTSNELYNQLSSKVEVPLIRIDNFLNKDEIEKKGIAVIKKIRMGDVI